MHPKAEPLQYNCRGHLQPAHIYWTLATRSASQSAIGLKAKLFWGPTPSRTSSRSRDRWQPNVQHFNTKSWRLYLQPHFSSYISSSHPHSWLWGTSRAVLTTLAPPLMSETGGQKSPDWWLRPPKKKMVSVFSLFLSPSIPHWISLIIPLNKHFYTYISIFKKKVKILKWLLMAEGPR